MFKTTASILLGVSALLVFPTTTVTQTPSPGDVVACNEITCPAHVSLVVGTYGPTIRSTNSATVGHAIYRLGAFQAGTSVRIGTCGIPEAAFTGNTFLRLFIAGTTTQVALNNDGCAGPGSQINYVAPYDVALEVHAGCSGSSIGCGGTIALIARLDATPRPAGVTAAFGRVFNQGVLGISPDIHTLIRGINYQGAGWGEKYHHQGIARTYNRATYDIAWTTSVRNDPGSALNNVFFTRMGTRTSALTQRFGSNVFEVHRDIGAHVDRADAQRQRNRARHATEPPGQRQAGSRPEGRQEHAFGQQ